MNLNYTKNNILAKYKSVDTGYCFLVFNGFLTKLSFNCRKYNIQFVVKDVAYSCMQIIVSCLHVISVCVI